jgi:hypothetical protein
MSLFSDWSGALKDLVIRHPNPGIEVVCTLTEGDHPILCIACPGTLDTRDQKTPIANFVVSNVELTYFPGDTLARTWLVCAWVGYLQHEGLELSTHKGERVLDPHAPPFQYDRGLRQGFPVRLTPESLRATLEVVMSHEVAESVVSRADGL